MSSEHHRSPVYLATCFQSLLIIWGSKLNPLTPGTFCKKCVVWTFWWFLGWISAKLHCTLIRSKMHLQHSSLPFLPPALRFSALWLGHAQKSKFWDSDMVYIFKPWPNGVASRRRLKTWVYLRLRLARPCMHLRWCCRSIRFQPRSICSNLGQFVST